MEIVGIVFSSFFSYLLILLLKSFGRRPLVSARVQLRVPTNIPGMQIETSELELRRASKRELYLQRYASARQRLTEVSPVEGTLRSADG